MPEPTVRPEPPSDDDFLAMARYYLVARNYSSGTADAKALYDAKVDALNAVLQYVTDHLQAGIALASAVPLL